MIPARHKISYNKRRHSGYVGVTKEEAITMEQAKEMKKIECPAPCSFTVKSHDEKEIVELAMQHAQNKHNMKISEKELKGMIKPA